MADLANDKTHLVLINALVVKDGKILIGKRSEEETHEPGSWAIPGGKIERTEGDVWQIAEQTLAREVEEETGVIIEDNSRLICNNTFIRSTGHHVIVFVYLCNWKSGVAKPLEDTTDVKWIKESEIDNYRFPPNVKDYLIKGFDFIRSN